MQSTVGRNLWRKLLRSVVIGVVALLLLLLITAVMMSEEVLPLGAAKSCLLVSLGLAAAVSGGILASGWKGKKIEAALLNAGELFAVFLVYSLAAGQGSVSGGQVLLLASGALTGSITGCVIVILKPRRRSKR